MNIEEGIEKVKKNIVIVGNGFDISLGLKSSYHDFVEYIKSRKRFAKDYELYNYNRLFLRKYEDFNLNWSDFENLYEETVRKINNRSLKNAEPQDFFDIVSLNDSIKRLEEDFKEYLSDEYQRWIGRKTTQIADKLNEFTEKVNPFFEKMIRDKNSFFINFNYTNTIEDICESIFSSKSSLEFNDAKSRVYHLHGSLEEGNILFGGGFTDSEDIKKIHYSQSLINDKMFRIKENESLNATRIKMMSDIDLDNDNTNIDLFIIGHSLQGSDFLFLSKFIQKANKIYIFYYEDDYIVKMEEILRKLGSSVAEKVVLVPFLEILLQDRLFITSYKEYQTIDSFLSNKFPREDILSELSLTINHFTLRNINELRISPSNIEKVLHISRYLLINGKGSKVSRVYFEETMDSVEFTKLSNSEDFLTLLKWVEKVIFSNTEIDSDFFIQLLKYGNSLSYMRMENCTIVVNGDNERGDIFADISVSESLRRLEIIDCSFTSTKKCILYIGSNNQNNIEKLTVLRNTNLVIEKSVFEKSTNLIDLDISITDDVYQEEIHLKNIETLQMDHTYGFAPNITVGNKIEEIIVTGYSEEFIKLSSIMKNNEESVGFPNLRLFHLKSPDQMTSCQDLIVDVILDVFSNNTKFIVHEDIKSIKEYYLEYREPHLQFFNPFEGLVDNSILLKIKDLFDKSNITDQSIIEEVLEEVSSKLEVKIQTNKQMGQEIEQKEVNGSNQNNEYDLEGKSDTNKNDYMYTTIDSLLCDYATGNITFQELSKGVQQERKNINISEIYGKILNEIKHIKFDSKKEILDLKHKFFEEDRDTVIRDFSEKWFVSKDELYLSAVQYHKGDDDIPNIRKVIDSRDYESYKAKHPEVNPIKYAQAMKQDWQRELDEKIVWLNDELG
ncbi:AbiH family protein [Paenibacillus lactis]|uniref:Uncharacterized protein n=1 Tax=Paenibacillus lactis 154 TaxID=743719 RepID=G4HIW9_9BACL|nr:AbiH family protein [Paenibacillus lactis]EHB62687.1 hypothetical protein PaelaDRAFT_3930 [Paenibacillus lactis 154]